MKKNNKKKDNLKDKEKTPNLEVEEKEGGTDPNSEEKDKETESKEPLNEQDEQHEQKETNEENEIKELEKKCDDYAKKMQKVAADFENYKKRVIKEKQTTYADALIEAVEAFLPLMDNFERALKVSSDCEKDPFREGIEMLFKQFEEAFFKLGVKEIKSIGETFDPLLHNAVMHIEDESFSEGEIIEELQKGYLLGDKIIRHSMVKVAN